MSGQPAPSIDPSKRSVLDPPHLPPAGFNPLGNPDDLARLEEFWLPSRPPVDLEAELYEHWREMFSPPLYFVWANSQAFIAAPFDTSTNWSGAYANPTGGHRFTRVVDQWQVPEVRLGAGPNPFALPFTCSIWIGIDGKKRWSRSMPQVGTVQTIGLDGTSVQPSFWWQWWLRHEPSAPHEIAGVPIQSGDVVLCNLTAMSENLVRFHVKNRNTGHFATLAVYEPEPLRGTTAEWVVERPANFELGGGFPDPGPLFPLPDYGSVTFEHCAARLEATPASGDLHRHHWQPRLIRMVQTLPRPSRTAIISRPTRQSQPPASVTVTYRQPG